MNLKETIKPVTYMKTNAADILSTVSKTHRPMIITHNGEGKMVIQDIESYQNMKESLDLLKIVALGRKSVERKNVKSATEAFKIIEKRKKRYA
ncbi:MAG: type II toxin-antitoxin system Phd/YefM family antitoxin [Nitrospirae bacterium]|nr:type II toxin-antitoxin system Phd/YefM family antitoxin [Nitrospirota bacterium]MBI3352341.1 type II toxin-antitoxin system Phd/YefM family antitoxin [Nitrospirota bacterium]